MNFKITTFKTIFSIIMSIIITGFVYGYYDDRYNGIHPISIWIITFMITTGIVYTVGSLAQK